MQEHKRFTAGTAIPKHLKCNFKREKGTPSKNQERIILIKNALNFFACELGLKPTEHFVQHNVRF